MTAATGNYVYLRQLQETAARRRLDIAKMLRDNPATTNKQLAAALNVSRNTITQDRKALMEQVQNDAKTETELLRAEMVEKLEHLNTELELHRKDGKLPVSVIHEALLVTRSIIELLGVRKPVVEKLEVKRTTLRFQTQIVSTSPELSDGKQVIEMSEPKQFELVRNHLELTEGSHAD
jgi:DNA-binding CsgD family transcriptional regulator